ncbi:small subunit ribosomal protein S12e [Nematocida homosporus]|uniref:small subunit ribosomal protein S12e n=1 Tax=Nematocida homosporus TaxID=1912981 RepID=UPI0022209F60|nr:small subunit ribosomal protein S12e [Nematocida homosporus]KAI5184279.1 small subunit ribosomal protein S12e [Nematocida homosporus]
MDCVQQGETTMSSAEAMTQMCFESIKGGVLVKGLRQVTKSIISKRAKVVLMSKKINEPKIVGVIEGLAREYQVPIFKVETHEDLGEYVRISKLDETGKVIKPAKCAVAAIEDFGAISEGQKQLFASATLQ